MEDCKKGYVFWFTGLSGAGKTTLTNCLGDILSSAGYNVRVLDGDAVRDKTGHTDFSREGRARQVRRVGAMAREMADFGSIVICALISPYEEDREEVRSGIVGEDRFSLIFLDSDLDTLIERDVKGLYRKALDGEIDNFTGISDPYEPPEAPDLVLNTSMLSVDGAVSVLRLFAMSRLDSAAVERAAKPAAKPAGAAGSS